MANKRRLAELGTSGPLAEELAKQIDGAIAGKSQVAALTPLTGAFGSPGNAIVDATNTFSQSIMNNNFRALEDKLNAVIAALKA